MNLITSLTIDASLLRKLLSLWDTSGDPRNPFSRVLVTPLFASPSTLKLIREELKEKRGSEVFFDSGGYYVQQGKMEFAELYRALRDYYCDPDNQWADHYVLPDHVPTSDDTIEAIEAKVFDTVTVAKLFHAEMPPFVQDRVMPVIQGRNYEQLNRCLSAYYDLGATYVGFGSFGTNGTNNSINIADQQSAASLEHITRELRERDIRLHTFGVSTPPLIFALKKLGVYSFDSLGWQRSAGYGKVYMPFTRAYNVSHRSTHNSILTEEEFRQLKSLTGHQCPFCEDFHLLQTQRLYRSLHNLVAVMDTVTAPPKLDDAGIANLIAAKSARYYGLFEAIYRV